MRKEKIKRTILILAGIIVAIYCLVYISSRFLIHTYTEPEGITSGNKYLGLSLDINAGPFAADESKDHFVCLGILK